MSTDLLSATEVERYKQGAMFDIASGRMPRYPMLPERAGEIDGQDAYTGRQLSQVMGMLFWAMERYAEKQASTGSHAWLPISSAPGDGREALVYRPLAHKTNDPNITIARLVGGNNPCWPQSVTDGEEAYNPTDRGCHVTHWMPLPETPSEQ